MSEKIVPGPLQCGCNEIQEAVCINTRKIFDSCRDQDCIEDLRFYPVQCGQDIINNAISVKSASAELLHVYTDVEPVAFNRGFYTIDLRYFYRVTLQVYCGCARPTEVEGLCVFDKRVMLFGGEGGAKVFTSDTRIDGMDQNSMLKSSLPTAVVEAVDPIVLDTKLVEACERRCCDCDMCEIPSCICDCFGSELSGSDMGKRVFITLGQFSIVRLERDTQLLIPTYSYCMPEKECDCGNGSCGCGDPCELFRRISFPVNEFFPPDASQRPCDYDSGKCCCCSKR